MYDLTYTRLHHVGFEEKKEHPLDGLAWFENGIINVLQQQWDETMTIEMVLEECQRIRDIISKLGENPWNTYYLLCANNLALDDEKVYLIEHNSLAIRKYVLRTEIDLNRIPFLDLTESFQNETNVMGTDNQNITGIVKEFVEFIIKNDGANVRFSKDEVNIAIHKVLRLPGDETI
jgi:hypothetical protein